jgi:hypothetical protein
VNRFEVFREISIGGLTKEELIQRLVSKGIQFNKYANLLFQHQLFSPENKIERVKLVKVKHSDFGLYELFSYQEFVNRASADGLRPCPLYLAAFLRLEYLDQPEGPCLTIASTKPESDPNYPNGFYIRNYEKSLWLRGYRADDFCEHPKGNEFIFLK